MKIGSSLWFSNEFDAARVIGGGYGEPQAVSDLYVYENEMRLALLTEELGFDSVWMPEHHFSPYAMTTNQVQLLTYIAARTERVELGTQVSVLPWHDPMRLAEGFAVLDLLVGGERRIHIGVGRGFARREYDVFGVDKSDALLRFQEALEILRLALTRERFSYDGTIFQIPETGIRPRPATSDMTPYIYGAWRSDPVMEACAHAGIGHVHAPLDAAKGRAQAQKFNEIRRQHGWDPVQPAVTVFVHCAETEEELVQAREWGHDSLHTALWHYDFLNEPPLSELTDEGRQGAIQEMMDKQLAVHGTPEHCVERLTELQEWYDAAHFLCVFRFGQMPFEVAEKSMRLFAKEALPALQTIPVSDTRATPFDEVAAALR